MIAALMFAAVSQAQVDIHDNVPSKGNPWYEVSIVIFKQPHHLLQSEQWQPGKEISLAFPRHLVSLEEPSTANVQMGAFDHSRIGLPKAFLAQPPTDNEFVKMVNRLSRSPNYDILYQNSWLQPGLNKKNALPVLIQAGKVYDGLYELEGTATLYLARYLHFQSNLWLSNYVQQLEVTKPWWQNADDTLPNNSPPLVNEVAAHTDAAMAMGETITRYQSTRTGVLNESRRMRSGELHYLDHPLFGIVVKVTLYQPIQEKDSAETDNDQLLSAADEN
ncbi:MAG: hypothetical protein CSA49_04345 [Gammaproteobacteria bacterium]|nr:MAG: hypothetical protein CSA49_04345 [Gammaproteobacteria bacterium]